MTKELDYKAEARKIASFYAKNRKEESEPVDLKDAVAALMAKAEEKQALGQPRDPS